MDRQTGRASSRTVLLGNVKAGYYIYLRFLHRAIEVSRRGRQPIPIRAGRLRTAKPAFRLCKMGFLDKRTLRFLLILEERKISRGELASRSGLKEEEINRIIDDGYVPDSETCRRIASILQVEKDYLFGSEEQVNRFLEKQNHWHRIKAQLLRDEGSTGKTTEGENQ